MLTCKELTELITDYLEGELSFVQKMRFQFHIGMCKHCRAYIRQMRTTVRALGKLPSESIPPEVHEQLLQRFKNWKR